MPAFFIVRSAPRDVGDAGDRQMRRRAGGSFAHGRIDAGGAALGNDDGVAPGALGRANDRADVVRVGDVVEHDEQPVGAPAFAPRSPRRA